MLIWDPVRVNIVDYYVEMHTLSIHCKSENQESVWAFTRVYGPIQQESKHNFWEEIDSLGRLLEGPWIITSNFNTVIKHLERSSGRASRSKLIVFLNFIDEHRLLELDRSGPSITYSNGHNCPTYSRLDKFLANTAWLEMFREHVEKTIGIH